MRRIAMLLILLITGKSPQAQRIDIDLFGGLSNYQGDLQPAFFTFTNWSPGAAVIAKIGFTDHIFLRTGFSFGSLAGDDANNRADLRPRNLRFRSGLQEFSAGLEYRLIRPDAFAFTPYGFVGLGIFRFNPYTFDPQGNRIFLQPLGTEGQGLPEYPEKQMYRLTQFCIPYGLGIKWQVNCNFNVGFEFRHTKTFTDYLDDVSGTYADEEALRRGRGQLAVDYAWRRDEFDGRPYPRSGSGRGNPLNQDWYYFAGFTVGLRLNDCETGAFTLGGLLNRRVSSAKQGSTERKKSKKQLSCPRVF